MPPNRRLGARCAQQECEVLTFWDNYDIAPAPMSIPTVLAHNLVFTIRLRELEPRYVLFHHAILPSLGALLDRSNSPFVVLV